MKSAMEQMNLSLWGKMAPICNEILPSTINKTRAKMESYHRDHVIKEMVNNYENKK